MGSRQVIDSRLNPDGDSAGLVLSSVAVGYNRGKANEITVLDQVNAEVTGGQLVGLVGPNGAGKSTLLRTVAGLQPALSGTITINGHEVAKTPQRTIAKMLAAVLTDRQFGGRLRAHEVVALGRYPHMGMAASLTEHDRAVINDALEAVGAGHLANRDITQLSDGQRQRVLVARALAQSPSVMVLDEPTAFLDPPGRIELIELLREVSTQRKIAMVVCTHDVDIVLHYADQFWIAGPGTRVHIGEPGELVESGALEAAFATDGVVFDQQRSRFISARMAATTASP